MMTHFLHSASVGQAKYSILSNKDIEIYFRMSCISGNNQNSCKQNTFENTACPTKVVTWFWDKLSIGTHF